MEKKSRGDRDLIFLRDKIAEYLLQERPIQKISGIELSRKVYDKDMRPIKRASLENLCRELRWRGYTREDVKEVISRYKDKYDGQINGAGLIRDAGGRKRFWQEMKEILKYL